MQVQPAFTAVAAAGIPKALFGEVECRDHQALCQEHEAGRGGWPTVRVFTSATGAQGSKYVQKTHGMVCDELKSGTTLEDYVRAQVADAAQAADATGGEPRSEL